jgi:hypothetical protein
LEQAADGHRYFTQLLAFPLGVHPTVAVVKPFAATYSHHGS